MPDSAKTSVQRYDPLGMEHMFVSEALDLHVAYAEDPNGTLQGDGCVDAVHGVMVEMGVGGKDNVRVYLWIFFRKPLSPRPGGVIPPRIDDDSHATRTGNAERRVGEILKRDLTFFARIAAASLKSCHAVIVFRKTPRVGSLSHMAS